MSTINPSIDILQTPSQECINPVWNCISWRFRANDYLVTAGAKAFFTIEFPPDNYGPGIPVEVAGRNFESGLTTTQKTFKWSDLLVTLTAEEIATEFSCMLLINFDFTNDFEVIQTNNVVTGIARNEEEFVPFTFSFPVAVPPSVFFSNGVNPEFLPKYQVLVQIWICDADGVLKKLISTESYVPNPETLEVEIDISRKVAYLVKSSFPGANASPFIFEDDTIVEFICLRYGQIYDENVDNCDVTAQFFGSTEPIRIGNLALNWYSWQVDTAKFCPETLQFFFMTNQPLTDVQICDDGFGWLWFDVLFILESIVGVPGILGLYAGYFFEYTDGTSEFVVGNAVPPSANVAIIPSGPIQIFAPFADPLKTVRSYIVSVGVLNDSNVFIPFPAQGYKVVNCCDKLEFYFLNAVGGFDTIVFNQTQTETITIEKGEFLEYFPCGGNTLEGGIRDADILGTKVFKAFTFLSKKYQNRDWLAEFFLSPEKYVRTPEGPFRAIRLLTTEVPIFNREEDIFVEFDFVLNREINVQQN